MCSCQIGADEMKKILDKDSPVSKIPNLDLGENDFGDAGMLTLCEKMYFNSNLRHLSIEGNFQIKSKARGAALEV